MDRPIGDLDWAMANFVGRVPGVLQAFAVASDGLLLASSDPSRRDQADSVAAIASGLVSLTSGAANLLHGGRVAQTLVELDAGMLLLMALPDGTALVTWSDRSCDIGQVGYELALLADRIGQNLSPTAR